PAFAGRRAAALDARLARPAVAQAWPGGRVDASVAARPGAADTDRDVAPCPAAAGAPAAMATDADRPASAVSRDRGKPVEEAGVVVQTAALPVVPMAPERWPPLPDAMPAAQRPAVAPDAEPLAARAWSATAASASSAAVLRCVSESWAAPHDQALAV